MGLPGEQIGLGGFRPSRLHKRLPLEQLKVSRQVIKMKSEWCQHVDRKKDSALFSLPLRMMGRYVLLPEASVLRSWGP